MCCNKVPSELNSLSKLYTDILYIVSMCVQFIEYVCVCVFTLYIDDLYSYSTFYSIKSDSIVILDA